MKPKHRRVIWKDQGRRCCWCDHPIRFEQATLEHLLPKVRGGKDGFGNLAVACEPCNRARKVSMGNKRFQAVRIAELLAVGKARAERVAAARAAEHARVQALSIAAREARRSTRVAARAATHFAKGTPAHPRTGELVVEGVARLGADRREQERPKGEGLSPDERGAAEVCGGGE